MRKIIAKTRHGALNQDVDLDAPQGVDLRGNGSSSQKGMTLARVPIVKRHWKTYQGCQCAV